MSNTFQGGCHCQSDRNKTVTTQTIMPQTLAVPKEAKPKLIKPKAGPDFYTVRPDGTATVTSGTSCSTYNLIWGTCNDPGGYCVQDCGCYKGAFGRATLAPDCRHARNLAALLPGLMQAIDAAKAALPAGTASAELRWASGPGAGCPLCGGPAWTAWMFCGAGGYQSLRACGCGETGAA